jgi:hypothetical protein
MANRINRKWRKMAEENERLAEDLKARLNDCRSKFNNAQFVEIPEARVSGFAEGDKFGTKHAIKKLEALRDMLPPEPASIVQKCIDTVNKD